MKLKKIIITFILTFILSVQSAFAATECIYSYKKDGTEADVTITYDEDEVSVEGKEIKNKLESFKKAWGALSLAYEYEEADVSSPLLTKSIDYAIANDACPGYEDEVFVCAGIVSSMSVPVASQVFGAGEFLATLVSPIWEKYDSFWDYLGSLGDSIGEIFEVGYTKEVLIVSGSQADAEQSYGYTETGWWDINWSGFYRGKEDMDFSMYSSSTIECDTVYYIGDKKTFNMNCPYLADLMSSFEDATYKYEACKEDISCKTKKLNEINDSEDKLKKYCSSILENQDYYLNGTGDSDDKINVCIPECLSIKDKILTLKNDAGIITNDKGQCGFSARLLIWLKNIFKWIKYILPVVVIVLGILDFIKAIGSDKEDEMKKAQKQFIIRLIAAALVFIVPLILEFVIGKMGFIYKDCGII